MSTESSRNLVSRINSETFAEWYAEREFARNVRSGQSYFNGPSPNPDPERHSPSQLRLCHRKIAYRQANAPAETPVPTGIFWTGRRFEQDLVLPYLRQVVAGDETYVRESMWVDDRYETAETVVHYKGQTDPVVVTATGEPLVVTEVKTKDSVDGLNRPNDHHRAQVHAYMRGLSDDERTVEDAVIIYGDRTTLEVRAFHEPFDEAFWQTTLDWAGTHTSYREAEDLPPADPQQDWECEFCAYRHRCGQSDKPFSDEGPDGLLPSIRYPRDRLQAYLDAADGAKLTPTLAREYPNLAAEYEVREWRCPRCAATVQWSDDRAPTGNAPALCPACASRNELTELVLETA